MRSFLEKYGISVVLLLLIALFSFTSPAFLTVDNLMNVARQVSMIGITAVGMSLIIITAGIDLSVGSLLALTGIVCAQLMVKFGFHPAFAIVCTLAVAAFIGLINGVLVVYAEIPPLIATLGMMTALRGLAYIFTAGLPVYGLSESFAVIGQGYFLGIPVPVIIMAAIMLFGWIFVNRTVYGRYIYGIGGNAEATRLSGVSVKKNTLLVYVLGGLFTGIAGIIALSRISSGQPSAGVGFELDVITAVVLGGISIMGGQGRFIGVLFGVLIMGVLSNGLVLLNVYDYYQMVIKGLVLLAAVGFDQYAKRAKKAKVVEVASASG
ncbi:ABC transporter permease [Paenibacillaceae bacterium WGS1546]|uniref:ABC transporter permease n=1 Tax=Cohnella sp. WGS1546 TaxID=3366810 RepID=UPI00372D2CC8